MQYYAAVKRGKDGRYLVTFPDFPEAMTDGADMSEAFAEARDCLEEAIVGRINRDEEIPLPSRRGKANLAIPLAPEFTVKVHLYQAWRARQISKTAFARMLGVNEKEARRLLDPRYGSKLPIMEEALNVLGKHILINVEDLPGRRVA